MRRKNTPSTEPVKKSSVDLSKYEIKVFDVRPKSGDMPLWCKFFTNWSVETCVEYFEKNYGEIKGTIYQYKNEVYIPYDKKG